MKAGFDSLEEDVVAQKVNCVMHWFATMIEGNMKVGSLQKMQASLIGKQ
jgi:hypothetical protein